jgi:hypothetical protein
MMDFLKSTFEMHESFKVIFVHKNRFIGIKRKLYVDNPVINFEVTKSGL